MFIQPREHIDYHTYIQSEEWKQKAARAKERARNRCQLCNVSGFVATLHAHHNNYERLGDELDRDIVVLCEDCHALFHQHRKPGSRPKIDERLFSAILRDYGITFNNDDPYRWYERGKAIIQHIVDGWDEETYDYYNKINIHVLDTACENSEKRDFLKAKENDWYGCGSEREWRANNDYWVGWNKQPRREPSWIEQI